MPIEGPQVRLGILAESVGFQETPELVALREEIVFDTPLLDDALLKYDRYHRLGQELVESKKADDYGSAQLGLNIVLARIWRGYGDNERYIDALTDARENADNMDFGEVAQSLRQMQDEALQDQQEVARLVEVCSGVIDEKDLSELLGHPLEYAIDAIYPLLYASGIEADDFLKENEFSVSVVDEGP